MRTIEIGRRYRHFKGKDYKVIAVANHTETGDRYVVYKQLYAPFETYIRPYEMFCSEVDKIKYPDVEQRYRFQEI